MHYQGLQTLTGHRACNDVISCGFADGAGDDDAVQHADIELLSWKKVTDVTKDGGVIKKVLRESTDYKTATVESTVKVRWAMGQKLYTS